LRHIAGLSVVVVALGLVPASSAYAQPQAIRNLQINYVQTDISSALKEALHDNSLFLKVAPEHLQDKLARDRLIKQDMQSQHVLLNNFGYYDPVLIYQLSADGGMTLNVDLGPQYFMGSYTIADMPDDALSEPAAPVQSVVQAGQPAMAEKFIKAEADVLAGLAEKGYAQAVFSKREYIAHHDKRTLSANLAVEAGPQYHISSVSVMGLDRTHEDYVRKLIPWPDQGPDQGPDQAIYAPSKLQSYRQTLLDTELFSTVRVEPELDRAQGENLPIKVDVAERKPRTIGGSVGYDSDRGAGLEAFWQHRNYWGSAERVDLAAKLYQDQQLLRAGLRVPHWPDLKTTIFSVTELANEQSDAYNQTGLVSELGAERKLTEIWSASLAGRLRISNVNSELVSHIAVPLKLMGDASNSKLDPTSGWKSESSFTPVIAMSGEEFAYATWAQRVSGYQPLNKDKTVVLAGWAHIGGTFAADAAALAPTSRFYAGGGGSVRGFEFRSIGDRDASGDPLGGASVAEAGMELRFPLRDDLRGVVFTEVGSISNGIVPDFSRPLFAAGMGVRYMTSIAPLRFDIAVPINGRDSDSAFQVYFSIGQAF
jgi:translocation and assembly module TamA